MFTTYFYKDQLRLKVFLLNFIRIVKSKNKKIGSIKVSLPNNFENSLNFLFLYTCHLAFQFNASLYFHKCITEGMKIYIKAESNIAKTNYQGLVNLG